MGKDEHEISAVYEKKTAEYYSQKRIIGTLYNDYLTDPAVKRLLGSVAGKTVLDIGFGHGGMMTYLKKKGAFMSGVEISPHFVDMAKKNPDLSGSTLKVGSVYNLHFKNKFDICICLQVLDQAKNLERAFKEISKILKNNGIVIVAIAHPLTALTHGYTKTIENYFKVFKGTFSPKSLDRTIPFYFRNFTEYSKAISRANLVIEKIIEPQPIRTAQKLFPRKYECYMKQPEVLIFKLRKLK